MNTRAIMDNVLPCDLTSPQRMPADSHTAGCVKYASMRKKANNQLKIATWNVRGLNVAGKLDNVLNEMKNLNLDICGISETFWSDSSDFCHALPSGEKYRIIYSGGEIRRRGVAVILEQKISNLVKSVHMISERIIAIKINSSPVNTLIVQCYAPTLDSSDEEKTKFYDDLRTSLEHKHFQDILVMMGDFNGKVGDKRINNIVGPHGLGDINSSGQDLINFCSENDLFIANTWFEQKPSARHTWTSPDGNYKNQIDFVCVSNRFRNSVTNAKAKPGSDCGSDHNPVVINMRIKLKRLVKKTSSKKWDVVKTKIPDTKTLFSEDVSKRLETAFATHYNKVNIEDNWKTLKEVITSSATENIGTETTKTKKKWMTMEILNLMETRKIYKNSQKPEDKTKYTQLKREIQKLCRQKKEEYLNSECAEAERLESIDSAKFHKKVKEMMENHKKVTYSLNDANGNEIFDSEQMLKRWKEYCAELYNDERPRAPQIEVLDSEIPQFTVEDIKKAISHLSNGKACGSDNIPAEFLKLSDQSSLTLITDMINVMYKTGNILSDFLSSTFITLPKVNKAKNCSQFRTISLISHASKILLQLIKQRINGQIENSLSETQMGFRAGKGCRDALTVMRILLEKNINKDKDVFVAFIDYEKAFDNINHEKLIKILQKINIPKPDIRLIVSLYWGQNGKVRTSTGTSEEFQILKGVRQGCIISPLLFNVYAEQIIKEAFQGVQLGISLNGRIINNLRYADDLVLLANTKQDLVTLLENLHESSIKYNMKININKSKVMLVSKKANRRTPKIEIDNQTLEGVNNYKYLGANISSDGKSDDEIKRRIAIAKTSFWRHKEIMRRNISRKTKLRLLQTYIFSVMSYGCESWTLKEETSRRINSFENWCYRRMLKVSWRDRITNCEILRRMGKTHFEWLNIIRERKIKFAGHVLRGSSGELMLDVMECNMEGTRGRGRPRRMWFHNISEWLGMTFTDCKTLAQDRQLFRTTTNLVLSSLATIDIDDATE
ncbi:hypothetical protein M8J77_021978 [Diaphorina citri]|nr:hypothetical protein M8J77_021978 [Diaphorina citri]